MKKVLIFGGTTEGRRLTEILPAAGIFCEVSVATEYGKEQISPGAGCIVQVGRKNAEEMKAWMQQETFAAVVDATHPFATEVSENIKESAKQAGLPYLRLSRETEENGSYGKAEISYVEDAAECRKLLEQTEGNILLTTGSKELSVYAVDALRQRLFVRVLPAEESIMLCKKNGLLGSQVIAMQGPFSLELNKALLQQYHIAVLVTKESGLQGGFPEKIAAAQETGTKVIVIKNPEKKENPETGTMQKTIRELEKLLQCRIPVPEEKIKIYLTGTGMGTEETLTGRARKVIEEADIIFGAERMLAASYVQKNKQAKKLPYYLFSDIMPQIRKLQKGQKAVLLFSGDSGFYSGAAGLTAEFTAALKRENKEAEVEILPGISSLSYLAAKAGIFWQDAKIVSIHGKSTALLSALLKEKKLFLITSGVEDMQRLGELLMQWQLSGRKIIAGYQMSYPEEEILYLTPEACRKLAKPGLYSCFILNEEKAWGITPGFQDAALLRDKVPMTKEEIREISLCKLHLTKDAVLYDVGSGTGSIAVEAAFLSEAIKVYAIEKKPAALELIQKNCDKFAVSNVQIVAGEAPEVLEELPAPTHVFLGGTGGNLFEILQAIQKKAAAVRVVANAISLETVAQFQQLEQKFVISSMEIVQIQVSRSRTVGGYHLMQAENPVYICSFELGENNL